MTKRFFGICGALTALVSGSCIDDPLADLDGGPAAIVTSHSELSLTQGAAGFPVTVSVVDGRAMPLEVPIAAAGCDAAVTATADTSYHPVPPTSARFIVAGVGAAGSCVNFTAAGLTQSVDVVVLPTSFAGTPSATTLVTGQTLTLTATASLQFNPATADVNFGGGYRGFVTNRTATSLSVIVPIPSPTLPGPITVDGIAVTYVPGLQVSLPTAASFTVTNPYNPNDFPLPPATATFPDTVYEGFAEGEADNLYTFTLAASTTLTMSVDWVGGADLDLYLCNAACSVAVAASAGSSKPETFTATVPAGTYNVYVNNWVAAGAPPASPMYRITIVP